RAGTCRAEPSRGAPALVRPARHRDRTYEVALGAKMAGLVRLRQGGWYTIVNSTGQRAPASRGVAAGLDTAARSRAGATPTARPRATPTGSRATAAAGAGAAATARSRATAAAGSRATAAARSGASAARSRAAP